MPAVVILLKSSTRQSFVLLTWPCSESVLTVSMQYLCRYIVFKQPQTLGDITTQKFDLLRHQHRADVCLSLLWSSGITLTSTSLSSCVYYCCLIAQLCPTLLQPHELQPTGLLCSWDFPGKNIRVGCHFLLQKIFLMDPGIKPTSCALVDRFFTTEPPGKPASYVKHQENQLRKSWNFRFGGGFEGHFQKLLIFK